MQQIIGFFVRNGLRLFFLLLLGVSLGITIDHHNYHRSKFINSSNSVSGYIHSKVSAIGEYFSLKKDNERLLRENLQLKELLLNQPDSLDSNRLVLHPSFEKEIEVIGAKIIKNSYRKQKNILTLKGGTRQGIRRDMGVINDKGIVGIIDHTSSRYATVLSVLNTDFQTVAKIKKNNHFGTLTWNGKSTGFLQLIDIPRIASVTKGDTIVTGFSSKAFPEDIFIGTIEKVYLDENTNSFTLDVKLLNDMTTLNQVYVVENIHKEELLDLEEKTKENE